MKKTNPAKARELPADSKKNVGAKGPMSQHQRMAQGVPITGQKNPYGMKKGGKC
jgi:hypothetical protein